MHLARVTYDYINIVIILHLWNSRQDVVCERSRCHNVNVEIDTSVVYCFLADFAEGL